MSIFEGWWLGSALLLVLLAGWIGTSAGLGPLGILIDGRGRYSLTHFQTVVWTIVILSSATAVLISTGFDPAKFGLNSDLLGLMGISVGSAVLATGVKASKDAPGSAARVARTSPTSRAVEGQASAKFSQIWLEEEGDQADRVISISKFQNFVFTLVVLGFYISLACKKDGLPVLPENVLGLIGISQAGYVGGKMPNK